MKFFEQLQQLERLDALIRKQGTGQPSQLAKKFAVCERKVYSMLEVLRGLGADIAFGCGSNLMYIYIAVYLQQKTQKYGTGLQN